MTPTAQGMVTSTLSRAKGLPPGAKGIPAAISDQLWANALGLVTVPAPEQERQKAQAAK